jgi:hypothetical protein
MFRSPEWPRLLLDLIMLIIAAVHLCLLVFDSTYFRFRNLYYFYLPNVVKFYDPVKGLSPHQFTSDYLTLASEYFSSCHVTQHVEASQKLRLIELSDQMIEENPFERAAQSGQLEIIKENMRRFTGVKNSSKKAFRVFWEEGCARLELRETFYHRRIGRYIQTNYWRKIDKNGQPTDYFLMVDFGFIMIFLLEFLISWLVAIRRFGPDQKILFPLYHWYDLVSCIPLRELRYLRLLRIFSLYVRLVQSEVILIKEHPLYTRFVKYQRIILEEISDQVALNILSNIQAKTRLGTNRELIEEILKAYRDPIQRILVQHIQKFKIASLQNKQAELAEIVAHVLWESIQSNEDFIKLKQIPFLNTALDRAINQDKLERMANQSIESTFAEFEVQFKSPQMTEFLQVLVGDILDQIIEISQDPEIQDLIENIHLTVLEELKKSSTAKTWKEQPSKGSAKAQQHLLLPPADLDS